MTETQLKRHLITAIITHRRMMNQGMFEAAQHIRRGEYNSAQQLLTDVTTQYANFSLLIRSELVKHGYLENEA